MIQHFNISPIIIPLRYLDIWQFILYFMYFQLGFEIYYKILLFILYTVLMHCKLSSAISYIVCGFLDFNKQLLTQSVRF